MQSVPRPGVDVLLAPLASDPFRPVDWRWARARRLLELDIAPSRHDDEVTRRAVHYLRALRAEKGWHAGELHRQFPDVRAAHRLQDRGGNDRLIVQARLLAGQAAHDIAARTELTPAAVSTYGFLFFDVAAHLKATDWVVARTIGPWADGPSAAGRAALLKAFAYFGGPRVLDALLPVLLDGGQPAEPPDLSTMPGRLAQTIRLTVATALLPDDSAAHRALARLQLDLLKRRTCGPPQPMLPAVLAHHAEANLEALVAEAAHSQARKPMSARAARQTGRARRVA